MQDHTERKHSRYGGSVIHRVMACPGSVRLCENAPKTSSVYADEGTRAHQLLETSLGRIIAGHSDFDASDLWARSPQDMRDAVQVAVDYVEDLLEQWPNAIILLEHSFELPSVAAPGEVFGTADIVIYIPEMRLLYVIDYKHGAGVFVEVIGNKQARFYARGAINYLRNVEIDAVAMVIIQPRCVVGRPIRDEWVAIEEIHTFGNEMEMAIAQSKLPNAELVAGEKQCEFCPAAVFCPAREKQALATIGTTFGDVRLLTKESLPVVDEMTPDRIGYVLAAAKLAEDWFSQVRSRATALMRSGGHVPGWKLVQALARRTFNVETEQDSIETAVKLSNITEGRVSSQMFSKVALVNVTEAEKLVKQDARDNPGEHTKNKAVELAMEKFAFTTTKKSSGNLVIAPESDDRPAVDPSAAAFSGVVLPPIGTAQ